MFQYQSQIGSCSDPTADFKMAFFGPVFSPRANLYNSFNCRLLLVLVLLLPALVTSKVCTTHNNIKAIPDYGGSKKNTFYYLEEAIAAL